MSQDETIASPDIRAAVGRLLLDDCIDEASRLLLEAIGRSESSDLWNDWAVLQLAIAERALESALRLDPWNARAATNLGVLLFSVGRLDEAEPLLMEAVSNAEGPNRAHLETLLRLCAPARPAPAAARDSAVSWRQSEPAQTQSPSEARTRDAIVESDVDLVVPEAFFPDRGYRGTMIEVGAAKPDYLSVGASFRSLGWRVISVEPNPHFCAMHRERGLDVIQCACGNADRDNVSFFVVRTDATYQGEPVTNESFSSLGVREKYAEMMKTVPTSVDEIKVNVRRLDTILREHASDVESIDIVCIDVEGWELEVLDGLSFARYAPKVLIIENLFLEQSYLDYFDQRGYAVWKRLQPNDIFVRRDLLFPAAPLS